MEVTNEMIEAGCIAAYGEGFVNWPPRAKDDGVSMVSKVLTAALAVAPQVKDAPAPEIHVAWSGADVEAVARRIYEDAHKGMGNIWGWDDDALDDEHPGQRKRYLRYAQSAVSAIEDISVVSRTKSFLERKYATPDCSEQGGLQDLLSQLDRQKVASLIGGPNAYADPLLCADEVITYVIRTAREVTGENPSLGEIDLDIRALSFARQAYDRKFHDMSGPTPTEEPEAGDGPLGYAIRAYLYAWIPSPQPMTATTETNGHE